MSDMPTPDLLSFASPHQLPVPDTQGVVLYPLFVYGTLKHGESNYPRYLAGHTTHEQPATLFSAALYTEGRYPYLVIDAGLVASTEQVSGTLMTIRHDRYAEVMRHIDSLEAYTPGDPENWYERVIQTIHTAAGPVQAWTYVAGKRVLADIHAGRFTKIPGGLWTDRLTHHQ